MLLLQGSSGRACSGVPSHWGGSALQKPPHLPTRSGLQPAPIPLVSHVLVICVSLPFAKLVCLTPRKVQGQ